MTYCQSPNLMIDVDTNMCKQLLYCSTIFFLHCLYDYNTSLTPDAGPGQPQTTYILIESFVGESLLQEDQFNSFIWVFFLLLVDIVLVALISPPEWRVCFSIHAAFTSYFCSNTEILCSYLILKLFLKVRIRVTT